MFAIRNFITLIALCSIFSGCSFVERNTIGLFDKEEPVVEQTDLPPLPPAVENRTSKVEIDELQTEPAADDVQILWKIPENPVDGFIIYYGNSRDDLDKEVRLASNEIERYDHPDHGPIYRFFLKGIPARDDLFVSISAYTDTLVSEPSEVFEVTAER